MSDGKVYISSKLVNKMGIELSPNLRIRVGGIILPCRMIVREKGLKSYMLSPKLSKSLYIKKSRRLKIRYDYKEHMIHLGPTIGILSTFLPNKEEFDPKSLQAELIYLSNMGRSMSGQIYIFIPASINWHNNTARGYTYRQLTPERGLWTPAIYPLPDVVYDRIASRDAEARESIIKTKKRLAKVPYLHYFNASFFNKWKVHQMLVTNPDLQPYLPETKIFNAENVDEMLKKYHTVYFKPCNGSLGHGIIKVKRSDTNQFKFSAYRGGKHQGQAEEAAELIKRTGKFRKSKNYIVQQGLQLATYKGAPFDIRIIFQKNRHGEWQISKQFVRVAPIGSTISNLSNGGHAELTRRVFKYLYYKKDIIHDKQQQIKNLCNIVANTLEKVSMTTFGELGLDLGLDIGGSLWLIEVNSKPRKSTETEYSQAIVRNTFKRPLEYGVYLAGF